MSRNMKAISTLFLFALISLLVITGCSNDKPAVQKDIAQKSDTRKAPVIDARNFDTTVKPAEDFYLYANGGWKKNYPLPDDKSRFGSFDLLIEEARKRVQNLVKEIGEQKHPECSIADKIATFYQVGMDTAKIESQGLTPLKEEFERIKKIKTIADVQNVVAHYHSMNLTSLFSIYAGQDSKNSKQMIAILYQVKPGMGDRDYYTSDDERSKELRVEYLKHLQAMFRLLGDDEKNAKQAAKTVMKLETRMAKASMTRLESRNPHKTYNKMSQAELKKLSPKIDWNAYFNNIGVKNPGDVIVRQPGFYKEISAMMGSVPIKEWKTLLRWNLINSTAPYLSSDIVDQNFHFFGKVFSGKKVNRPRWQRVLDVTSRTLSEALGQLYVKKHFPPEAKTRMVKLVSNLKASLAERIQNLDWMSDVTKKKGLEKLEAINVKIGYPDEWRDYSGMEVKKDAYVLNVLRGMNFNFKYRVNKIGKPVNPKEWHMPPQMVNAYYSPNMNEICFPAAILEPPFFYKDADDAVNYGAIGVVIGHEMIHGFDDKGRLFDKDGNLNSWWTEEDSKKFNELTEVLVKQYNSFIVVGDTHADGKLTLGENIADLAGLTVSFNAFRKALKANPVNEKIEGFTPQQRFFLSFAHVWAQNITEKEMLKRTREDVHSLGRFRVNGPLPNMKEFHEAFNTKEGDKMYLPESERAKIW